MLRYVLLGGLTSALLIGAAAAEETEYSPDEKVAYCTEHGNPVGTLAFANCVTKLPSKFSPETKQWMAMTPAQRRESDECESYGAKRGTGPYIDCMAKLSGRDAEIEQQAQLAAQRQAAQDEADRRQRALELLGAMNRAYRPIYQPAPAYSPPPSIHCTTITQGVFTNTDCH